MVEDDLEIVLKKKFKFIRIPFVGESIVEMTLCFKRKWTTKYAVLGLAQDDGATAPRSRARRGLRPGD